MRALLVRLALVATALSTVAGCRQQEVGGIVHEPAIVVEEIPGADVEQLSLSEDAMRRLGIVTSPVDSLGDGNLAVPFAAVVYDADGQAWAYTSPEDRVFVREPLTVARIVDGAQAVLLEGPAAGTHVVVVGAAELWGAETGVGGGH